MIIFAGFMTFLERLCENETRPKQQNLSVAIHCSEGFSELFFIFYFFINFQTLSPLQKKKLEKLAISLYPAISEFNETPVSFHQFADIPIRNSRQLYMHTHKSPQLVKTTGATMYS